MTDLNRSRNLAVRRRAGCFHGVVLLPVVLAAVGLIMAGPVTAQTFKTLYSFTASRTNYSGVLTNGDGGAPVGRLILSGNTLYGTAQGGGSYGNGTVFAVNTDGTAFTNLYNFSADSGPPSYTNSDGANPYAGLILSANTLYGTASGGGSSGRGTVFAVNTNGTEFTNLHSFTAGSGYLNFTNSDGTFPSPLFLSGNTLYGTANSGGISGHGTVFAVKTDGTGFTTLHTFSSGTLDPYTGDGTNSDGAGPNQMVLSINTLYGTAVYGGSSGYGTVFAVNTNGTGFTTLYSFTVGSDGASPYAGLMLSGNTLYGTTEQGGTGGSGTVFNVNTNGTGFTNLHNFTGSDGVGPTAGLILSGNTLYGTTGAGGSAGVGTVFALNTDGTGFTNLHSFMATSHPGYPDGTNSDGAIPRAELLLSGNTLYGTAQGGGSSGNGTVFSLSFRPQLTIIASGTNVILTWPTNYAGLDYTGYRLQSTTNLASPVWTTNSPAPVIVNGQNTVTNPISATQQFYRLSQ